jgi:hypothetical protein
VIVTDRGRPSHALLNIEDYYTLAGTQRQSLLAVMDAIPWGPIPATKASCCSIFPGWIGGCGCKPWFPSRGCTISGA